MGQITMTVMVISPQEVRAELRTEHEEPNARFAFVCRNGADRFSVTVHGETPAAEGVGQLQVSEKGTPVTLIMKTVSLSRPLTPERPLRVTLRADGERLNFAGAMHLISDSEGAPIPSQLGVVL